MHCVEWNCHYFFHLSYFCLFLCCLLVLPYYMVNKDEYIIRKKNFVKFVKFGFSVYGRRLWAVDPQLTIISAVLAPPLKTWFPQNVIPVDNNKWLCFIVTCDLCFNFILLAFVLMSRNRSKRKTYAWNVSWNAGRSFGAGCPPQTTYLLWGGELLRDGKGWESAPVIRHNDGHYSARGS